MSTVVAGAEEEEEAVEPEDEEEVVEPEDEDEVEEQVLRGSLRYVP